MSLFFLGFIVGIDYLIFFIKDFVDIDIDFTDYFVGKYQSWYL